MDNAVVLIQARMASERLAGKVMMPLAGRPVLAHVVERCRAAAGVGRVVVATTTSPADDELAAAVKRWDADIFRGDEADVLGRLAGAAAAFPARHYIRVTADCPLTDPALVAEVLAAHAAGGYDFSYNDVARAFPRGYDVEVLRGKVLNWLAAHCRDATSREHVTPYLFDHAADFNVFTLTAGPGPDCGGYRLVLDEPADYELLRRIFERLRATPLFGLADVLALLAAEPALAAINRHVSQRRPPPTPRAK